ncbi:MAG: Crp/Fnr family transcriptional regulator [Ornithinimicrobium sp.]
MTFPTLAPAGDALWRAIAGRGTTVRVRAGTVMLHHGEGGTHCYAVVSGEVLVSTTTRQGATVVLGKRGPGNVLGELAALDVAPRSATATARTDVTAVTLTASELEKLLRDRPDLAIAELRRLGRQLRTLTERYTLRNEDLRTRIVGFLFTHLEETGERSLRLTRQELADWVGVTREAVTRTLRELERERLVSLSRSTVVIVDPVGLGRLAGS